MGELIDPFFENNKRLKRELHDLEVEIAPWRRAKKIFWFAVRLGVFFASFIAVYGAGEAALDWLGIKEGHGFYEDEWGMTHEDHGAARMFLSIIAIFVAFAVLKRLGKGRVSSDRQPWRDGDWWN